MAANPLLDELRENDSIPSTSVALPTSGYWYADDGTVLVEDADPQDLVVHVLGVIAEQNYKDPFMLITGKALPKLIRSVCPEIVNPEELADVDLDAILIATRIVSYGSDMKLEHTCGGEIDDPENEGQKKRCGHKNELNVDLYNFIGRYSPMDQEYLNKWNIKIEPMGQTVFLRPMPYKDSLAALRGVIKAQRGMEGLTNVTYEEIFGDPEAMSNYTEVVDQSAQLTLDSLTNSIHHVELKKGGSVGDKEAIKEWLLALPADTVDEIKETWDTLMKDVRKLPIIQYRCQACDFPHEISLQMDPQRLFMKAGDSKTPTKPSQQQKDTKSELKRPTATAQRSPSRTKGRSRTKTSNDTPPGK